MKKTRYFILIGFMLLGLVAVMGQTRPRAYATSGAENLRALSEEISPDQALAQTIAMTNSEVADLLDSNRAEMFQIFPITEQFANCAETTCLQANIYDFDANATLSVIIDIEKEETIDVFHLAGSQPILNNRLQALARDAMVNSIEVREAIGFTPVAENIVLMQSNHLDSPNCASDHNCAAAVFIIDGGVVWVLYDGTEEQIDKIWWGNRPVNNTEIDLSNEPTGATLLEQLSLDCNTAISIAQNGWSMTYETTRSDSLRVSDIRFNGNLVMTAASLVEWHADYGNFGFRDSTGCSSGGGGFQIYPFGTTQIYMLTSGSTNIGFEVVQDFRMGNWGSGCNYRYEQHFQFFNDGSWRIVSGAFGKGCGNGTNDEAIYRPVWRMDIAVDDAGNDTLQKWDGTAWQSELTEAWYLMDGSTQYTADGYMFRMSDSATGTGYFIEPGQGQFGDNGTGDNAYIYLTRYDASQGASDISLLPSTTCCADDHNQGPDEFINGESTKETDIVLWYVPQSQTITSWMVNNGQGDSAYCWTDTSNDMDLENIFPCWSGPRFVPDNDPLAVGLSSSDVVSSPNYLLVFILLAITTAVSILGFAKRRTQA